MIDPAARRRLRRAVARRRRELDHLGEGAYDALRREVLAGALGPVPDGEGWLYEDFHGADKDAVFTATRAGTRIGADAIVPASRLYTPRPIVDLLLQNTLGALWLQMHPHSPLAANWPLLVPEVIGPPRPARALRTLRLCDPCCGGGAFLLAAFDLLLALYADERRAAARGEVPVAWCGSEHDAPALIVTENLWGGDLDAQAAAITARELSVRAGGAAANIRTLAAPLGTLHPQAWAGERFDVVCTNPPWIGFRQLDRAVKQAVCAAVPDAAGDLAVATQSRCFDLTAEGGRLGTVTPAAWLVGRDAQPLRRRILAGGGPVLVTQLGQGVFDQAPLVYVAASVIARGDRPAQVAVARGRAGWEGAGVAALLAGRRAVAGEAIRASEGAEFAPAAPDALLALGTGAPRRVGDVAAMVDGIWTGDNARDLRYWWECAPSDDVVAISGGQGYQRWAAPTLLRIAAPMVADRRPRGGCLEYARVAGGRLGVRVAQPNTAALAGVVTIVPHAPADAVEILAIANSRIGAAWVATLTAGLNFNPGYLARIPLGSGPVDQDVIDAVDGVVQLRLQELQRDPTHDGFTGVPSPWRKDDLVHRREQAERAVEQLITAHLGLDRHVLDELPPLAAMHRRGTPVDDYLLVQVLGALGFRWPVSVGLPAPARQQLSLADAADIVAQALVTGGAPPAALDPARWVRTRLGPFAATRFRRRPPLIVGGGLVRLAGLPGG